MHFPAVVNKTNFFTCFTSLAGTKLIFVVGESGAGKTTLLGEITDQILETGDSIRSGMPVKCVFISFVVFSPTEYNIGTVGHQILPAIVNGKQYIFVDTPGFSAADMGDKEVFEDIIGCLKAIGPFVSMVGVMFVFSVRKDRLTQGEMKTIRWLQCFCGPQFFQNITLVMTQWDRVTEDDIDQARRNVEMLMAEPFSPILNPPLGVVGGSIYYHGIPDEHDPGTWIPLNRKTNREERVHRAANLIRERYETVETPAELQIQVEMDRRWKQDETEAARCLFGSSPSTILVTLRHKCILLDGDEQIKYKPKYVKTTEAPQEKASGFWKWLNIAKQTAYVFSTYRLLNKEKWTDVAETITLDAWEKLKNWWSGEPPPQEEVDASHE